ncbi:hypothetical protein TSOC_003073 [Tetrabaena socialis]|uniref:Uncharacterized protein n=1 Tax=Tetrabaena socialis TaxID=47790 RepID=A0A2J8ACF6_9CHLO|nr:hypothetical protein TSOC_003073 [Tetrabaena socialis]|eukprot:PNH10205.1 hypothetical protein TSOC_003073 [Tetrabaena socialis]
MSTVAGAAAFWPHAWCQAHHVLAADDLEPERDVAVLLADDDALYRALHHQVGELVEGAQHAEDFTAVAKHDEQPLV